MNYDDIIHLPHPVSKKYPRLSMAQRAAQFNPFAALTGYDAAVEETVRLTEEERWLDEESIGEINSILAELKMHIREKPVTTVCWFEPDERKAGGAYRTITGPMEKLDEYSAFLRIDGEEIPFARIMSIEVAALEDDFSFDE